MLPHGIKEQILKRLIGNVNLYRVILFGSYVSGTHREDSDIDLLVVTDDDFIPATFEENMQNYLKVSKALGDIKKNIPIDLIVHTKPMYEKFIKLGSMFSKKVTRTGETVYEKDS
jgi:uncharacterized protein